MYFKNLALLMSCLLLSNALMAAPAQIFGAPKKTYTVAITQYVDSPALSEAYSGILAGLKEQGYSEDKNLKIIFKNAQGDMQLAHKIAQDFIKLSPNLIISISTPSTQAVVKADNKAQIPVVFSTVTDPLAAKIVPTLIHSGSYVTGVYDLPPVSQQVANIREIMPNLKTIGVVYNPNEANSARVFEQFKNEAKSFKILTAEVTSTNAVAGGVNSLMGKVEAIYIPQDNTVQSDMNTLLNITMENRVPVFASDHGSVRQGALAAISDDQYEVGYLAGKMAALVLSGRNPGQMDVVRISHSSLSINTQTAKKLNINIPEKLFTRSVLMIQ